MKSIIIIYLILISFFSCKNINENKNEKVCDFHLKTSDTIKLKVYSDKLTKAVYHYKGTDIIHSIYYVNFNCVQDSTAFIFYKNGNPELKVNYSNGILHGIYTAYFEDGSINNEVNMVNGLRKGEHNFYYPDGTLKGIIDIKNIEGNEHKNGQKIFFSNNSLNKDSTIYFKIITNTDTVNLNDSVNFYLEHIAADDLYMKVIQAYFDKSFKKIREGNTNSIERGKEYSYIPKKIGKDTIRVLVNVYNKKTNKINEKLGISTIFLEKEIYVTE